MPDRLVPLEGTLNFRDLGGYPSADGQQVRWRTVFRGDSLASLTQGGWRRLGSLGIRTIVDFRRTDEVDEAPTLVPESLRVRQVHLAIGDDSSAPELLDSVMSGQIKSIPVEEIVRRYRALVQGYPAAFGALLTALAEDSALPAVFHCTAGKDRTGIGAALLLISLGVDEQLVLDDYELSTHYRTERRLLVLGPRLADKGVAVEDVLAYLSAPRPALAAALQWMRDEHGSVEGYLLGPGHVEEQVLDRLRALLLESA